MEQLLLAGARCLGKTVTDELAFGLNGENFFFGTPLNPRAPDAFPADLPAGPHQRSPAVWLILPWAPTRADR